MVGRQIGTYIVSMSNVKAKKRFQTAYLLVILYQIYTINRFRFIIGLSNVQRVE